MSFTLWTIDPVSLHENNNVVIAMVTTTLLPSDESYLKRNLYVRENLTYTTKHRILQKHNNPTILYLSYTVHQSILYFQMYVCK